MTSKTTSINSTHTYVEFMTTDDITYNFTGGFGSCKFCTSHEGSARGAKATMSTDILTTEDKIIFADQTEIICCGLSDKVSAWIFCCKDHFDRIASKPQFCNICNKKAVIRDIPKLCTKCLTLIYDNCSEMNVRCEYPVLTITECGCKYCKIRF